MICLHNVYIFVIAFIASIEVIFFRSDVDAPAVIDVTIPLQCLINGSKLILTEVSKVCNCKKNDSFFKFPSLPLSVLHRKACRYNFIFNIANVYNFI